MRASAQNIQALPLYSAIRSWAVRSDGVAKTLSYRRLLGTGIGSQVYLLQQKTHHKLDCGTIVRQRGMTDSAQRIQANNGRRGRRCSGQLFALFFPFPFLFLFSFSFSFPVFVFVIIFIFIFIFIFEVQHGAS